MKHSLQIHKLLTGETRASESSELIEELCSSILLWTHIGKGGYTYGWFSARGGIMQSYQG
jgi:hypothetical protein